VGTLVTFGAGKALTRIALWPGRPFNRNTWVSLVPSRPHNSFAWITLHSRETTRPSRAGVTTIAFRTNNAFTGQSSITIAALNPSFTAFAAFA
jgi:hypothetical protein